MSNGIDAYQIISAEVIRNRFRNRTSNLFNFCPHGTRYCADCHFFILPLPKDLFCTVTKGLRGIQNTVERRLSGLIGTRPHPDLSKIQIFKNASFKP